MSDIAELLERFRRGPELVAAVTTGAAGTELDFQPGPDQWSVRQIVCHLADSEIVGVDRLRRVLAEENPVLMWYDEKAWARNLDYQRRKFSQALETFRRLRAENYELLKATPEASFARQGQHSKQGPVSLLDLLRTYAEHAENHCLQIQKTREAYRATKSRGS